MKLMAGESQFYQLYFQEPGLAEGELEADVRTTLRMFLYSASGDPPPEKRWRFLFGKSEKLLDSGALPETLPGWLTEPDLDFFTGEFERTGFRGGLNWYRNLDRMWELTPFLSGAKLRQPSLFVAGEVDAVLTMYRARRRPRGNDAQPPEQGGAAGCRALDSAGAPSRGQCAPHRVSGRPVENDPVLGVTGGKLR